MKTGIRQIILLVLLCLVSFSSFGQFGTFYIGVDGLTCSQCQRNVEMKLKKLDFVKDMKMDLESTEGVIYLKENSKADVDKIAKAVTDAGFSVRFLKASFRFENIVANPGACYPFAGDQYQFVAASAKTLNGDEQIQFLGPKYMEKKEYKKWIPQMKNKCSGSGKTYFVTVL